MPKELLMEPVRNQNQNHMCVFFLFNFNLK